VKKFGGGSGLYLQQMPGNEDAALASNLLW
jgi:hypothetical protein